MGFWFLLVVRVFLSLKQVAEIKAVGPCTNSLFLLLKFLIRSGEFVAAGRTLVGFSEIVAVPAVSVEQS